MTSRFLDTLFSPAVKAVQSHRAVAGPMPGRKGWQRARTA